MRGIGYLRDNLAGAWQVMLGRQEGLARVDTSLEGFWRSFAAIILVAPFAFLALVSEDRLAPEPGAASLLSPSVLVFYGLAVLADWFSFPLVFAFLARPFGLGSRYVPFIVVRNWGSVILAAMVAVIHALHLLHVLPSLLVPFALIAAMGVSLRFAYVIVRQTLHVSIAMALPIVVLDFLLSLVVWSIFDRFA